MTTIHRIIVAENEGTSYFAETGVVSVKQSLDLGIYQMFSWDGMPTLPVDSLPDHPTSLTPGPAAGGVRVVMVEFPADHEPSVPTDRPDLITNGRADGMHRTDTLDVVFVISGEIELRVDDGNVKVLRPGDALLTMGAMHAWRNSSTVPCLVAFVKFGAELAQET